MSCQTYLFILFFNNFLSLTLNALVHNLADDYNLSNFATTVDGLKQTIESEC